MVLVVPEQSQRPYRFGMTLLCVGALFNWLGLADTYSDPVPAIRYIGVGLIAAGASLICMAMCFWMRSAHDPANTDLETSTDPIQTISADQEKPPDYSTVVDVPPCYEEAIKLSFATILPSTMKSNSSADTLTSSNSNKPADSDLDGVESDVKPVDTTGPSMESNTSQYENAIAKVLRKSIRGIRRLTSGSGSDDGGEQAACESGTSQVTGSK